MPNRSEGHVVSGAPTNRLSFGVKLAYVLVQAVFIAVPPIAMIYYIPAMRDRRLGPPST